MRARESSRRIIKSMENENQGCSSMENQNQGCSFSGKKDRQEVEITQTLGQITNKILVMSGKGGVGKSSVAAYLALALHGPSIPRILGLQGDILPGRHEGKARPVIYLPNLQVISIETLLGENKDVATIWRGPLKIGVIRQFISDLEWGDLDYLIVDSPPGTGDEPLTVAQTIPDAKALIVTTPQEISLADVRKSIDFCRQVNMDILGIVENMSGLMCPHCGKQIDLFGARGGLITAQREHLRLLGSIPLDPQVVEQADKGSTAFLGDDRLPFTEAFTRLVDEVVRIISSESITISNDREKAVGG
jgi:ATP-binding protein involved in chromosome partitioning